MRRLLLRSLCGLCCGVLMLVSQATPGLAESPAPTVHWGGLAYPDQVNTLSIGYTGNRFTQFNGEGQQFNNISETMGFNFGSLSWTQHWPKLEGLSTNLTIGAGPTGEQPTSYLQNEFIHDAVFGIPKVPVARTRDEFDFMVDASATYWHSLFKARRIFFVGGGISTGSLYTEGFVRTGFRRFPIGCALVSTLGRCTESEGWLKEFVKGFHFSGMGRFGGIRTGAAFPDGMLSSQSYLAQGSLSWGVFDREEAEPWFEIEVGATIDSGLFLSAQGTTLEERFWTFAMRFRNLSLETWNDQLNRQDFGPTYGFRLTYNLYPHLFAKSH